MCQGDSTRTHTHAHIEASIINNQQALVAVLFGRSSVTSHVKPANTWVLALVELWCVLSFLEIPPLATCRRKIGTAQMEVGGSSLCSWVVCRVCFHRG